MGDAVVLTAPPTTVGVLLFDEPAAGARRSRQAFRPTKPQISCQQPKDDLAGIEDDGLAAGFAIMSGKGAIGVLETELSVDHAMRAADQIGAFKGFCGFDEGLDDIAGGFGVSGQPAILKAPAG